MVSLLALAPISPVLAEGQPTTGQYEPESGQAGKDVVWVPTPQALVDRMLDMAKVTPQDYLIDLGSGDGRTVITAAVRGLRAHGIEYNPDMVALAQRNAAGRRRERARDLRQGRPVRERFLEGAGHHAVPAAGTQ
ncbi:MAG: methyltransferase [Xanthobacteraceae bacterium]|jgi:SAM-dependent methyltransferase|nr:methyltransferase [Xanthobacteraceae bacterium]